MQALILAGGEGTRLRPLTATVPKPVLPLAGRAHVLHMIDWLASHGVDRVVLACGFLAAEIRAALAGFEGPELTFVDEPEPLGTAGAIRHAADHLGDRFFVLNGDVLTDLDLTELAGQHDRTGADATIALHPVADPSAYGLVRRRPGGEVTGFLEKPDPGEIDTDEINAGAYLLERSVLDRIEPGRAVSIEREVFPAMIGQGLYGCRLEGYWLDIGTPERFITGTRDILERRVRTVVADQIGPDGNAIDASATVAPTALLEPPVLVGAGATVGAGARVQGPAVIGSGSSVGEQAALNHSILFSQCRIGAGASIGEAILSAGVEVADGAVIADGEVVAQGAAA